MVEKQGKPSVCMNRQCVLHARETGNSVIRARMCELSRHRMCLELAPGVAIPSGSEVRVAFYVSNEMHIVPAQVDATDSDRLEVSFGEVGSETQRAIESILSGRADCEEGRMYDRYLQPPDWR